MSVNMIFFPDKKMLDLGGLRVNIVREDGKLHYIFATDEKEWHIGGTEFQDAMMEIHASIPRTYEEIINSNELCLDVDAKLGRRLARNGYQHKMMRVNISEFADDYFAGPCRCCSYTIDQEILTDDFLRKHLPEHYCLFYHLNRAPPFDMPVDQSKLHNIGNQELADYINEHRIEDRLTCVAPEFVRPEWLNHSDVWPRHLWTIDHAIREADRLGMLTTRQLPEHLQNPEAYHAFAQADPDNVSVEHYDAEFFRIIRDDNHFWSFLWGGIARMDVNVTRQVLSEIDGEPDLRPGRMEPLQAEAVLTKWPNLAIIWTEDIADHLRGSSLSHLIPSRYALPPSKRPLE